MKGFTPGTPGSFCHRNRCPRPGDPPRVDRSPPPCLVPTVVPVSRPVFLIGLPSRTVSRGSHPPGIPSLWSSRPFQRTAGRTLYGPTRSAIRHTTRRVSKELGTSLRRSRHTEGHTNGPSLSPTSRVPGPGALSRASSKVDKPCVPLDVPTPRLTSPFLVPIEVPPRCVGRVRNVRDRGWRKGIGWLRSYSLRGKTE